MQEEHEQTAPLSSHTENTAEARNRANHVNARTAGDINALGIPQHAHARRHRPQTSTLQTTQEIKPKHTWRQLFCRAPVPQPNTEGKTPYRQQRAAQTGVQNISADPPLPQCTRNIAAKIYNALTRCIRHGVCEPRRCARQGP